MRTGSANEVGVDPLRLVHHLDHWKALQDLLPKDRQLHLGEAVTNAPMDTEAEGEMLPRPRAVDDELVRPLDRLLVAVTR